MFEPFNESFVRSTVESTLDRHANETQEERAMREGQPSQPNRATFSLRHFIHALGRALLNAGKRLDEMGARETRMTNHRATIKP
jgi:hypothetical protein